LKYTLKLLSETYGNRIGKVSLTGYCIKRIALNDIHIDVLEDTLRLGMGQAK
jgi:hypothetical protein